MPPFSTPPFTATTAQLTLCGWGSCSHLPGTFITELCEKYWGLMTNHASPSTRTPPVGEACLTTSQPSSNQPRFRGPRLAWGWLWSGKIRKGSTYLTFSLFRCEEGSGDCQLLVSPLTQSPIRGEVNLLRYIARYAWIIWSHHDFVCMSIASRDYMQHYLHCSGSTQMYYHMRGQAVPLRTSSWITFTGCFFKNNIELTWR